MARRFDDFQIAKPAACNLTGRDVDVLEPHIDHDFLAFVPTCREGRERLALNGPGRFCLLHLTADKRRWTTITKLIFMAPAQITH